MSNELENSINYIRKKTGTNTGFSIPKDYLNGIEDDFIMKLKEDALPKTTSFKTPDTYFDTLEATILNKVNTTKDKQPKGKVITLKNRLLKFIPASIAASLLLFISIQFFNKKNTLSFNDVSYADIENWFDENTMHTDTELAFIFEDDLDENELTFTNVSFDNDVIEDYLDSIDHSDLLNEIP